jgi:transposase
MMSPYSEGPRRSMVSSLAAGMPTSQAARTFSVSLSSVKHYAHSAERGKSLAPKKRSGAAPKLEEKVRKLWEDLKERHGPHGSHQERGSVSPGACRQGRVATERDEFLRTAWRVMAARSAAPERFVYAGECVL